MSKSFVVCVLVCLFMAVNGFADILVVTDTQDATNWGDYFLPEGMAPKSGARPRYLPYYRWDNNDWGWTHTIFFEKTPAEIISATLEIEAWDVDLYKYEVNKVYGDGIYLGNLTPPPGQPDGGNSYGYEAVWHTTVLNLSPSVLNELADGQMDIWLDIDANTAMDPGEGCEAVALRKSVLTIVYSNVPLDDPDKPKEDPNEPPVDPNKPPVDPNETPNEPVLKPKTYVLSVYDASLPTINDPGDGISQIGVDQAWFAFDLSSIPDDEQVISAFFTADMRDYDTHPSQRTLWYDSDDSWIYVPTKASSDPGDNKAAEYIVGTVIHDDLYYTPTTIGIIHDWSNDLADDYITLMLTGPENGLYVSGAVDLTTAELEIITLAPGSIDDGGALLDLGPEEIIQINGLDIIVPGYSVPSLFDWNNDGLQDLIIGEGGGFGEAKVRFYLNIGTESNPLFSDNYVFYAKILGELGISDLTCPASGCLGCFPRVLDWDADLLKDMLVGQSDGTVKIFLNIFSDDYPIFDSGTFLKVGQEGLKKNIAVGGRATPTTVDWNNDGRKDLVVGALDGRIHIFINEGTDTEPDFISKSFAQENGADLIVPGGRSSPEVLDLDLDGLKDILTGNTEGQLLLYSNVGTDEAPEFSGYTLVESDGVAIDLPGAPRSRPFICDWTADGYLDVLVGAGDGKVHLFQGVSLTEQVVLLGDLELLD